MYFYHVTVRSGLTYLSIIIIFFLSTKHHAAVYFDFHENMFYQHSNEALLVDCLSASIPPSFLDSLSLWVFQCFCLLNTFSYSYRNFLFFLFSFFYGAFISFHLCNSCYLLFLLFPFPFYTLSPQIPCMIYSIFDTL